MEPTLQITLGPPPSGRDRGLFDEHQEKRRGGAFEGTTRWEEYETDFLRTFLLSRKGGAPGVLEELLSRALGADVVLEESESRIGWGTFRGLRVASVFIPASGIARADGLPLEWPPGKEVRNLIGDLVGYILTREWVWIAALTPESPAGRVR
jgi:hypothetical protein